MYALPLLAVICMELAEVFRALPLPDAPMSPVLAVKITDVPTIMPPELLIELPCKVTDAVLPVPTPAVAPMLTFPAAIRLIVVPPIVPDPVVEISPLVVATCNVF